MHGFCTVFARFQTVQRVLFGAKYDKECRNYYVKNHVVLRKNGDDSKLPSFETNPRLSLLISGPRVRVPGGALDIERQIVRFGVLSLCKKAAAHFLHTVCTFARIRGVHQPDGFKDLLTGDFCCHRLFVLPGLGCCRGQVLGIEVGFNLLGQLQPGLVLCVGVGVHQDSNRCVACVALNRLEVTVRLQELVGGTGMP